MAIRMVEDIGAPIAVSAIDLITLETAPDWNEWASYLMAGAGYVGAFMNFGGPFVKQIGVASLPLAARNIRERMRTGAGKQASRTSNRVAFRGAPVSRQAPAPGGVGRSYQPGFESVAPHAF